VEINHSDVLSNATFQPSEYAMQGLEVIGAGTHVLLNRARSGSFFSHRPGPRPSARRR
jgi:hypothetical protein